MWRLDRLLHGGNMRLGNFLRMIERADPDTAIEALDTIGGLFLESYPDVTLDKLLNMRMNDIQFRITMAARKAETMAKDIIGKLEDAEMDAGGWDGVFVNTEWKGKWRREANK
jgi:hypothetical protein